LRAAEGCEPIVKRTFLVAVVVALGTVAALFYTFQQSIAERPADIATLFNGDGPALSGIFSIRIESNKPVYRMGERIELRTTLINNTPKNLGVVPGPPYMLSDLIILNGQGHPIPSSGKRCCVRAGGAMREFHGEKAITLEYNDPENRNEVSEWADIRYWGYDLRRPGGYTITAIPTLRAFGRSEDMRSIGPEFVTSDLDKSNNLHITILR
jgi:hypothetical protein